MAHRPEPWLRGPIDGAHPVAAHLLYTFEQTREELDRYIVPLPPQAVWRVIPGLPPLGFQIRHMAGSIGRLSTYLGGRQLTDAQIAELKHELDPGQSLESLVADLHAQMERTARQVRAVPTSEYEWPRVVGRKLLPTTVAGLIIHLSEHTQRHLGQAVLTAQALRHHAAAITS
jgi:hypothetical protein